MPSTDTPRKLQLHEVKYSKSGMKIRYFWHQNLDKKYRR
tara:strand:+ start:626 stop:742 length:117 start_codon:yes stop_codon:yes gene_type:complete